jgi:putative FmdB family regulatory protein
MPVYEYQCEECGRKFELVASFAEYDDGLEPVCPKCASKLAQRIIGRPMIVTTSKSESDDFGDDNLGDSGEDDYGTGDDDMSGMDDYMDDLD